MKSHHLLPFFVVAILIAATLFFYSSPISPNEASAETGDSKLSGYAWSSNIGWISFNENLASNQEARIVGSQIKGYAWSSNIGWINFEPGGTPVAGEQGGVSINGNSVAGWARGCSVYSSGCTGDSNLKSDTMRGGWDGWIKMSGGWANGVVKNGNKLEGYAWGSDVVGWIDFCPNESSGACVTLNSLDLTCLLEDDDNAVDYQLTGGASSEDFTWEVFSDGETVNPDDYTINWSLASAPDDENPVTLSLGTGEYLMEVTVTPETGGSPSTRTCPRLEVSDGGDIDLEVIVESINGAVAGTVNGSGDATAIVNCTGGGGSNCSTTIDISSSGSADITLTADPAQAGDQFQWGGDCTGQNGTVCTLNNQTSNLVVRAIYRTPGAGTIGLSVIPRIIQILQQGAGQEAATPVVKISSTSLELGQAVCLSEFTSKTSGESISAISDSLNGVGVRCVFGNDSSDCSSAVAKCVSLDVGAEIDFRIVVDDRSAVLRGHSPFKLVFSNQANPDEAVDVEFGYNISNFDPR